MDRTPFEEVIMKISNVKDGIKDLKSTFVSLHRTIRILLIIISILLFIVVIELWK